MIKFENIGRDIINRLDYFGGISALLFYSFVEFFRKRKTGNRLVFGILKKQILFTGYDALPIISVVALMLGMVAIIQTVTMLPQIGADKLIGDVLVLIIIRELGPILTAIIVIGRSGTAISTEIGNMMVSEEFEALEIMGIDPLRFIVMPRLVGMTISIMCLTIYFDAVGLLGGYCIAQLNRPIPFGDFFSNIFKTLSLLDIWVALIKSFTFGAVISVICVYHGFKAGNSPVEVPRATTKAVVNSLIFAFVLNAIITALFYI